MVYIASANAVLLWEWSGCYLKRLSYFFASLEQEDFVREQYNKMYCRNLNKWKTIIIVYYLTLQWKVLRKGRYL
jgi:hypothetical protein